MIKSFMNSLYKTASLMNQRNILKAAAKVESEIILDLGCDDGTWTHKVGKASGASKIYGIEINPGPAKKAQQSGISTITQDLSIAWQLENCFFDLIHANQVIEHVPDVDQFASEIYRVLKPGGKIIISTENGSSWHNIFASLMGWQIFSLSNVSNFASGIGNPTALHRHAELPKQGWTHKTIFNYRGLKEFFLIHGFTNIKIRGAGYYPLPSYFGSLDVRHSHFLTLSADKPINQK